MGCVRVGFLNKNATGPPDTSQCRTLCALKTGPFPIHRYPWMAVMDRLELRCPVVVIPSASGDWSWVGHLDATYQYIYLNIQVLTDLYSAQTS